MILLDFLGLDTEYTKIMILEQKCKKTCHEVLDLLGIKNNPLLSLAMKLEKIALEDEYFIKEKLHPNVDFTQVLFYKQLVFQQVCLPYYLP